MPFPRSSRRGARSARSVPSRSRAPTLDRSSRPRASRRRRTTRDRGAGSSSTPPRASRRSPTAWARGGDATSTATASADARIDELVDASHRKITGAPALVLGCLTWDGLDRYPDAARQRAEWGMALLSLGAAVENLMLAAADAGLASCWVAAPIFCPEAARDALALDRRVAPPRARARRSPRPDLRRPATPSGPPRRAPNVPLTPADASGAGQSAARAAPAAEPLDRAVRGPSSRSVHGFQPRWISARPGSSAERASSPARGARVARRLLEPGEPRHRVVELLHARLDAGADVDDQPAALVRRADERVDDVVDEDEVAGLLAVAEDRRALPVEQLASRRSRRRRPRRAGPGAGRRRWRARAPCTRARGPRGSSAGSRRPPSSRRRTARSGAAEWPSRTGQRLGRRRRACRPSRRTRPCGSPPHRALAHVERAEDVDLGVEDRAWRPTRARRPARRGGRPPRACGARSAR